MGKIKRDRPAFPTSLEQAEGMTLRDYFAAKAMASLVVHLSHGIQQQDLIVMAEDAYALADAMLKAREAR